MRKKDLLKLAASIEPTNYDPVDIRVGEIIEELVTRVVGGFSMSFRTLVSVAHRSHEYRMQIANAVAGKLRDLGYSVEVEDNNGSIFLEIS